MAEADRGNREVPSKKALLLVVLSVLFSVPALAQAPVKEVEVITAQLMVEVTNPPPVQSTPPRFPRSIQCR